jgi:hypothetical protein
VSDDPDAAYTDDKLQTALAEPVLEKRLLKTYYDAKKFEEARGANILFLAIGFLRWFEADQADTPRHALLLLIPVQLERRNAGAKFTLRYDEADLAPNASLAEKLRELGLELPQLPEADELVPTTYFVRSARCHCSAADLAGRRQRHGAWVLATRRAGRNRMAHSRDRGSGASRRDRRAHHWAVGP